MDCSPPGSSVHGILQARILEWVAIPFSRGSSQPRSWRILYHLSHQGSPRILEWVAYPFSGRSSWPRKRTGFSCIAGGFFPNWAFREAQDGRDVAKHARCAALSPQQRITWLQMSTVLWLRIFIHLFHLKNCIERPHNFTEFGSTGINLPSFNLKC